MVQSWWFGCLSKTHTLLSCLCVHSLCSSPRVLLDSASACSLMAPAKPAPTSVLAKLAPAPAPAPTKSAPAPTTARSATATVRSATVPRSSVGRSPAPPVEEKLPPGELLQAFFLSRGLLQRRRCSFKSCRSWPAGPTAPAVPPSLWLEKTKATPGGGYPGGDWSCRLHQKLKLLQQPLPEAAPEESEAV